MVIDLPYIASIRVTVISADNLYFPRDIEFFDRALEYNYKHRLEKDVLH